MTHVYSLHGYGDMIADQGRMNAYRQALQQAIKPGAVVLDIGAGPGIMALMACQFGARRVYAIEPGDVIQVARDLAAANGYAEQIEFIQALSTQVTLPERADVIVSDLRGALPLFQKIIPFILDARQRFLAPGGVLIPRRDTLWAAVLEFEAAYQGIIQPWNGDYYGLDLSSVRSMVTSDFQKGVMGAGQMLAAPQCWATIDYTSVENPDVRGQITWSISRPGLGHGLGLWFDADLAPGIGFSNAPGELAHIYGRLFFPWLEPVTLGLGDTVTVSLYADLVGGDYLWRWETRVQDQGGHLKADFRQSTFFGAPLSLGKLQQMAAGHVPELSQDGRIDSFILQLMQKSLSLGEIARQVVAQFPSHFPSEKEALTRVGELSLRYGRPPDSIYLREK